MKTLIFMQLMAKSSPVIFFFLLVELTVNLAGNNNPSLTIQAPFLVSQLSLPQTLLGADVLIKRQELSGDAIATVVNLLRNPFVMGGRTGDGHCLFHPVMAKEIL